MTLEQIQEKVDEIKIAAADDERAHSLEDDLMFAFITWLAKECYEDLIREKAKLVLSTSEIDFARWCA